MLLKLIEDMNKALDHDCYFSALSLALTLPDICGRAKYPAEQSTKKRYIDWYDEYIGQYERWPEEAGETPYLSGEVVYQLRCSFLHQGTPNIDSSKIKEECCQIDDFVLAVETKKEFIAYVDSSSVTENWHNEKSGHSKESGQVTRSYQVNVRRLCLIISRCAEAYYEEAPENFNFFHFRIVDLDEQRREMNRIRELNAHFAEYANHSDHEQTQST